jgi:hypothetical protein
LKYQAPAKAIEAGLRASAAQFVVEELVREPTNRRKRGRQSSTAMNE